MNEPKRPYFIQAEGSENRVVWPTGFARLGHNADLSYAVEIGVKADRFVPDIIKSLEANRGHFPSSILDTLRVPERRDKKPPSSFMMYCTTIPEEWQGKERDFVRHLAQLVRSIERGAVHARVLWNEINGECPVFILSSPKRSIP